MPSTVVKGTHGKLNRGGEITHEGYLRKRGGFVASFKNRWCVLAGNKLYYFRHNTDPEPAGDIDLNGHKVGAKCSP
mgnify:CR=1 FL=1|jgi:hypothetical protein